MVDPGALAAPVAARHYAIMSDTETRPEYMTVKELAELLRIKERKVYDLAASGQVPCSRATGKLLFPEVEVRAWIEKNKSGPSAAARRPAVVLGSHDPLLDWALRESRCGFATLFDSSLDGLDRFVAGEGAAAGLHIHEGNDAWNVNSVETAAADLDAALIRWATRRRGLVVHPDKSDQVGSLSGLEDLRIAPRQKEAGAELLFQALLSEAGVQPETLNYAAPCRSEQDVILAVMQGDADVAFGLEALAAQYGLGFIPLINEEFDIVVDRRSWFDPAMQALLAFARSAPFQDRVRKLQGYDTGDLGSVKWNA